MSRWLALASDTEEKFYNSPDNPTEPDKTSNGQTTGEFCRVLSGCQAENETASIIHQMGADIDDCRHGFAINSHPKTWTGQIVSLSDWRKLSDWDRHGPDGRHWNGATRRWEMPDQRTRS